MSDPITERYGESVVQRAKSALTQVWEEQFSGISQCSQLESSVVDDAHLLCDFLLTADARTTAILTASFVEDALKQNFVEKWNISSNSAKSAYFGPNGPLSTFSQQILVANSISWIEKESLCELDCIRKIRNQFAHNHRIHDFSDKEVKSTIEKIYGHEGVFKGLPEYTTPFSQSRSEDRLRVRYFCSGIASVAEFLCNAKLAQHGLPTGFRPSAEGSNHLQVERGLQNAMIRFAFLSFGLPHSGEKY